MQFSFLSITASAVTAEAAKKKGTKSVSHKVKKGETMYSIAKKYGVPISELAKINNVKNNHIRDGQTLVIPSKPTSKKAPATPRAAKTSASAKSSKISKTAKTSPAKPVSKPNIFEEKIVEEAPDLTNKEVSETNLTKPSVAYKSPGVHYVKAGDTFQSIEKLYGLRRGELRSYSENSSIKKLEKGTKIQLPERVQIRNIKNKKDAAKALGVSVSFLDQIERIEKKRAKLYDDGAGNATVGIGHHAFGTFEKNYYKNRKLSDKEIYQLLAKDLTKAKNAVIKSIGQDAYNKMSTNQKEAVIDYVFNRGQDAFRSDDCAPLRHALKAGNYESAAMNMYTPRTLKNDETRLGVSKRRLYEIHHFCGGKFSPKVLKRVQALYNAGLASQSAKNDSTLAGHNKEINNLYRGKIKLAAKV